VQRKFHGRQLLVWVGEALVADISGWVSNPRLDLELKRFKNKFAGREPDQEEILTIMAVTPEFELKKLAEDIRKNGVQKPVILNFEGKLLDGNRRYFAVRYLIANTKETDPKLQEYIKIPVIVLDENCSEDDENHVLVQENFYTDLRKPWPHFVLASYVYDALENGESAKAVSQRYEWSVAKVNDTKKIMGLINEFISFASSDTPDGLGLEALDAERIAADNYQFFNEAQKSFYTQLLSDVDFKVQFFRWIYEKKFSSFAQVRVAYSAWEDDDLRKILKSSDPEAAERVAAAVAFKKVSKTTDVQISTKISQFSGFLNNIKASEIAQLTESDVRELKEILAKVASMAAAAASLSEATGNRSEN
jgi:hypothetical protein